MSASPSLMFEEAQSAATVVGEQIARNRAAIEQAAHYLRKLDPPFALTIARGSSDHAAAFAKLLFETRIGLPVVSQSPSLETLYRRTSPKVAGALALAISQSGRSPDLVEAAQAAKGEGAVLIAMVNDPNSPLARTADILLPLHAGPENSVAATKSFIASLAAIAQLAAVWAKDIRLHKAIETIGSLLDQAWSLDWEDALEPIAAARTLLVLGRGSTWPIASEAALKFKEVTQIHAESFSSAEVAHGPMALIAQGTPVFAFSPVDEAAKGFAQRLRQLADGGALVVAAGEGDAVASAHVPLPIALSCDPAVTAIGMIQSLYRFTERLARQLGHNPDAPPLLSKVTQTR